MRHDHAAGVAQLDAARAMPLNLSYQFSIFTREQEHKQQAAADGGGGGGDAHAVDLVSYVEFQKNYRSLLTYHKAALLATRDFWRQLMRDVIGLDGLSGAFQRIDRMEGLAQRTYKLVLER